MSAPCYPPGLLGVDEAVAQLLASVKSPPGTEQVPLMFAAGRILAEDVIAPVDVPPHANSAMDGIAFAFADTNARGSTTLYISQRLPAGAVPRPLLPGSVARIFTGAELPPGADSVMMQEDCSFSGDRVTFTRPEKAGGHIRPQGQDIAQGGLLLSAGQRLGPAHIGLLAAVGMATVPVYRSLQIALFSTGDELVEPGVPLSPGRIYNSNRYTLRALLERLGFTVLDLGRVPDTLEATFAALRTAVDAGADVILSSGGVSVGEEDHVKSAVAELGAIDLWRVAIKPGKPLAFGRVGEVPFLGLPGNPQSVWVTFLVLARPFLLRLQGQASVLPQALAVPAGFAITKAGSRRDYLRVRLVQGEVGACLQCHENQSSGVLSSAVWADGLALVEADRLVKQGDLLPFLPFASLLG